MHGEMREELVKCYGGKQMCSWSYYKLRWLAEKHYVMEEWQLDDS